MGGEPVAFHPKGLDGGGNCGILIGKGALVAEEGGEAFDPEASDGLVVAGVGGGDEADGGVVLKDAGADAIEGGGALLEDVPGGDGNVGGVGPFGARQGSGLPGGNERS